MANHNEGPALPSGTPPGAREAPSDGGSPEELIEKGLEREIERELEAAGDLAGVAWQWLSDNVLQFATAVQLAVAITAVLIGLAARIMLRPSLNRRWVAGERPFWHAKLGIVLIDLVAPVFTIALLWLFIWSAPWIGLPSQVLEIAAALATAWVVIRLLSGLIRSSYWARLAAFVVWLVVALDILALLNPLTILLDDMDMLFGQTRISLYMLLKGGVVGAMLLWLALATSRLVIERIATVPGLTTSAQTLIGHSARILLIVAAGAIALNVVGVDLTALAVFSGALGIAIGLGLQKIIANFISGIILLLDRSVRPGDVIEVSGTYGKVTNVGARFSAVRTRDGTEHLIPNEDLIVNTVINWSHTDPLIRVKAPVGIAYGSDLNQAINLVVEACAEVSRVIAEPAPRCLVRGFSDSAIDLEARFWVQDPGDGVSNVQSDVFLNIWNKFRDNGIEIPFPQRDLHIKSETPPPTAD